MEDIKLLGMWASPYVIHIKMALQLKNIPYYEIEQDLQNKSQLLLHSNPIHKKVPVLIHNNKTVCESLLILEYLDEFFPETPELLPQDPSLRACSRFWAAFIDNKLGTAVKEMYLSGDDVQEKAKGKMKECITALEKAFVEEFQGRRFFGGEEIGYMDVVMGSRIGWYKVIEDMWGIKLIDKDTTPALFSWLHHFCSIELVASILPPYHKLLDFASSIYNACRANNSIWLELVRISHP